MGYSFMHFEKIKSLSAMDKKYNHNYRKEEVLNADVNLAHLNEELVSLNGKKYSQAFQDRIAALYNCGPEEATKKIRSNAVMALEVVTTFSREDREHVDLNEWKRNNVEWLRQAFNANPDKYGDNVLSVMYHGDENGNVHCHAFIVPIDDQGHLNSSYYIDGRAKVIGLQDSYGKAMKEKHDLNRGIKGSPATHEDIRKFYTALNQELAKELPKSEEKESAKDYRNRVAPIFEDLNLQLLNMKKKLERKQIEGKAFNIDDRIEFYHNREEIERLKYENQKIQEDIEKLGGIDVLKQKVAFIESLDAGLQHYPDREKALITYNSVQEMIKYAQAEGLVQNISEEQSHSEGR